MSTHIQRDHIFNRSTRPLLETTRAQPQVQVKKKSSKDHKVHGFNDFNFVANQYKNLNSNIGYPYGSPPPSPPTTPMRTELNQPYDSANKMAIFSDDSGIHVNNISNLSTSSSTNYYEDIDNTYQLSSSIASSSGTGWSWNRNASHNERRATPKTTTATPTRTERFNQFNNSGPFIFGVHSNDCSTFKPASKASNERNESVIKATPYATKYSSIVSKRTPDSETYHESNDVISQSQKKDQRLSEKGQNRTKKDKRQTRNAKKHAEEIKCVLVGDGMVGKTNLIMSYLENRFTTEHVPTASDIYNCEVKVDDLPVQIILCDTAGQDFFDPLRRLCYPDSDVFLLCFSVVKPKTFKSVQNKWAPNLSKSRASIVLVGTQADLRTDPKAMSLLKSNNEVPVSKSDAWDYATSIGAKYIETSSRTNKGVKDAFDTAIWDAMMTAKKRRPPPLWRRLFCFV